jgi:apoptosis-stimulating of p53 protein 1
MTVHQQEQIEQNQQLLVTREQCLKYLNQQENLRLQQQQEEIKNFRLKTLQNQIHQQKISNSFESELEILKQIFLNKEHELTIALNKLDELTKQLDQLRKLKISTSTEQSQNKNQLEKLKQELIVKISSNRFFFNDEIFLLDPK